MAQQFMILASLLLVVILSSSLVAGGSRKRVIIHVPLHIKHHHHTHTIFKHVKHHERHHHDHHHDHHLHAPYGGHDSYKLYSYSLGHRHAPPPDFAPTSDEWGPAYGRSSYENSFPAPYDEGFDGGNSYESNGFGGWEDK